MSTIHKLLDPREGWVIFTAQNPDGKKVSDERNADLHNHPIQDLDLLRCSYDIVHGCYNGNNETSVIIWLTEPASRVFAASLAKKYYQESVLTPEGLVYQDGTCNPTTEIAFPYATPEDNYSILGSTIFQCRINFEKKI